MAITDETKKQAQEDSLGLQYSIEKLKNTPTGNATVNSLIVMLEQQV